VLDKIDTQVEELRKEALKLQEKRDSLLTQIDMLKNDDLLADLTTFEREEIGFHLKRVNERIQTVELSVTTLRDQSQVDSLHLINSLIDDVIRFGDPIVKRQKCQQYLNACSSNDFQFTMATISEGGVVCKKFEGHLLGCTLDDQKRIKRRLQALINYMAQQIISD